MAWTDLVSFLEWDGQPWVQPKQVYSKQTFAALAYRLRWGTDSPQSCCLAVILRRP